MSKQESPNQLVLGKFVSQEPMQQGILDQLPDHEFPTRMLNDAIYNPLGDSEYAERCLEEAAAYIADKWDLSEDFGIAYASYYASLARRKRYERGQA